jgi:hypothetical protein
VFGIRKFVWSTKRGSWFLPTVLRTCCRQSTAHGLGMQTTGLHFTFKGRKYREEFSNVFLYCILPCTFPQFLFSNNQSYFLLRNQWRPSLPSTGIPNLSPARCVDACSYTSILSFGGTQKLLKFVYACNLENFYDWAVSCSKWTVALRRAEYYEYLTNNKESWIIYQWRRRLGSYLKRLLDEAERDLSTPNS